MILKKKIVYVVVHCVPNEGCSVYAICTSHKKAEELMDKQCSRYGTGYEIREVRLNMLYPFSIDMKEVWNA